MASDATVPTARPPLQSALQVAHADLAAGRLEEAERGYRTILRKDGQNAEALYGLGLIAHRVHNPFEAARLMRAAIAVDLRSDVYRTNLGNVFQTQGLLAEAVAEYERALVLRPTSAAALSNLGTALLGLGRAEAAQDALRRALTLQPESAQIWDNLGNALQAVGHKEALAEAIECHQRALRLLPSNVETYGNLSLAQAALGHWHQALDTAELGLKLEPPNARLQLTRAQVQLLLGDFVQGWVNYESRKRVYGESQLPGRPWHGESIQPGNSLLVYAEQGLGDTIQFLRYLPLVQRRIGASVNMALEVQGPILRLAEQINGRAYLQGTDLYQCDWHCSLMSLPLVLGNAAIPMAKPYLQPPSDARNKIGELWERIPSAKSSAKLQVGIVWAGNRRHVRDRFRSIPAKLLKPILGTSQITFHSLQLGEAGSQLPQTMVDWREALTDMADTAALLERLDLVIGVDTAVIHLAGALGVPVWTMLPFWPDWRWGVESEDCSWYPTMRLFRQESPGDWAAVLERVKAALEEAEWQSRQP